LIGPGVAKAAPVPSSKAPISRSRRATTTPCSPCAPNIRVVAGEWCYPRRCRLRVKSRSRTRSAVCLLKPRKRTNSGHRDRSASCHFRKSAGHSRGHYVSAPSSAFAALNSARGAQSSFRATILTSTGAHQRLTQIQQPAIAATGEQHAKKPSSMAMPALRTISSEAAILDRSITSSASSRSP
jgi:hypothetical protein